MLESFATWLTDTIFRLGYPGIVILMAVESSAIPFPSEVVMPPAGYNAALGKMSFPLVVLAGVAGSLIGALANYAVAGWLDRWLRRYGKWLLVKPQALDRAEAFFRRHGEIGTFIGRLVPVVRQLISIPAGLARMRLDRFVLYTSLGAGIWSLILTWIGWAIGKNIGVLRQEEVQRRVGQVLVYLLPVLAVLALGYTLWYRRRRVGARRATALHPPADPRPDAS
jgi:membrane protein DedA with SNARE-associated domain